MTSKHWLQLYYEFNISVSVADRLPQPSGERDVDPRLLEALKGPHAPNVAERGPESAERYLENCHDLNEWEIYGLLTFCAESPIVTRLTHSRLFVAIAKYFARIPPNPNLRSML